ncbi:MAG: hypothetical protein IJ612_05545, partial [Prevotella sp.]|nr:hypothetical protein [Prevotella sp.]
MTTNRILTAIASAMLLASCTENIDLAQDALNMSSPDQANPNQVRFEPYMGRITTRTDDGGSYSGGTLYTATLKDARFGVFGYNTGSSYYAPDQFEPNFMYNQRVYHDDGDAGNAPGWVYSPVKDWPNGTDLANAFNDPSNTASESGTQMLSFFAYAPYAGNILLDTKTGVGAENTIDATTSAYPATEEYGLLPSSITAPFKTVNYASATTVGGVVGMSAWSEQADPWVNYVMKNGYDGPSTEATKGIDLLWAIRGQYSYDETDNVDNVLTDALGNAYNVNLTRQSVPEKVRFIFKHALAKFGGSTEDASLTADDTPLQSGLKVVVDVDANSTNPKTGTDNQQAYFPESFTNQRTLVTLQRVHVRDAYTYSQEPGAAIAATESNLNTYGWFNLANGQWENAGYNSKGEAVGTGANGGAHGAKVEIIVDNTTTGANINADVIEKGIGTTKIIDATSPKWIWNTAKPTGVTTTPKAVYANENNTGFMLIPGSEPQTLYVTVDYFVRTADPQLARGYSEVEQIITNRVDVSNLEANKYYTLLIHLGLTSVKFEAVVADWATNGGDTYDEDGNVLPGTPATEEDQPVWLPSNVVNTTTISASAGTTHKSVTVHAATTDYTVHLTQLTDGNKLEWDAAGNVAAGSVATISGTTADAELTLTQNWTAAAKTQTVAIKELTATDDLVSTTELTITQAPAVLSLVPNYELLDATADLKVVATLEPGQLISGLATTHLSVSPAQGTPTLDADKKTFVIGNAPNNGTTIEDIAVTVDLGTGNVSKTITVSRKPMPLVISSIDATGATYAAGTGTLTFTSSAVIDVMPAYAVATAGGTAITMPAKNASAAGLSFASDKTWLTVNPNDGRLYITANTTG